tara:strand:+ start:550 stop:924 length:375 start_codon:yes stop_codon:yes gene_type:complete
MIALVACVILSTIAPTSALSRPHSLAQPPRAETAGDVLRAASTSFLLVGTACLGWAATSSHGALQGVALTSPLRLRAGLHSAQRWGRVSAGFNGGRAAGQVWRRGDDAWCVRAAGTSQAAAIQY